MTDREELEAEAKLAVSAELYYELMDNINEVTDEELRNIIEANGDYAKECELLGVPVEE